MVCLLGECHVCRMSSLINAQEVSPDDSLHYIRHLSYTHQVSSQSNSIDKKFQKSFKICIAYIAISFLDCKK